MNTIKFSSIYEAKKETNNVEIFRVKEAFIGKKIRYYSNAPMSIYITKKCNAHCRFCMHDLGDRFITCKELSDDEYFISLRNVLDKLKDINPRISITGGEPTKSNRLLATLKLINEKGRYYE